MLLNLLTNQPPPDFLHDPFGQFVVNVAVAIVVGFVGAGVAIWIFRKQQAHRKLTYEIVSDAPLASVNKDLENRVTIQFDGKPVLNARLLTIRIQNAGNTAIKRDDYADAITFTFLGRTIIGSDVIATEPPTLIKSLDKTTFIKVGADTAELEKFLLNAKQAVKFTVFLAGTQDSFDVRGRIVDGEIVEYRQPKSIRLVNILLIMIIILLIFWLVLNWLLPPSPLR